MIKILNSNSKDFDRKLKLLLSIRKKKIKSNSISVSNIINDVKKNGDKALLKYEKRFNKNSKIVPSKNQISKLIKSLDKKVKLAIDTAYNRIYKFHSLQKFKNITYVVCYNLCSWIYCFLPIKCANECHSCFSCWCSKNSDDEPWS